MGNILIYELYSSWYCISLRMGGSVLYVSLDPRVKNLALQAVIIDECLGTISLLCRVYGAPLVGNLANRLVRMGM